MAWIVGKYESGRINHRGHREGGGELGMSV